MATLTVGQMSVIAAAAGLPGDPDLWGAIGMAESSGSTTVVNSIGCVGIWQINQPVHVKSHPSWTKAWLQNPMNNAAAAKVIYAAQGFGAWEAYTNGAYKKFYKKGSGDGVSKAFDPWDPLGILPDGSTDALPGVPGADTLDNIGDALGKTADVLVNPRTWLRVAYGITGAVLIIGGLLLIAKNSPVVKSIESNVQAVAGVLPQGKVAKAVKGKGKSS